MIERDKYENSLGDGHDDYYGDRQAVTPPNVRRKMGADRERDRDRDQNPPNEGDDGWVWGRYKSGGGGAPLRDVDGNNVANLRLVHHDSVQLQHSPTHSPKKSLRHGSGGSGGGYDHDDPYYSRGSDRRSNDDYDYGERVTAIPGLSDRSHPKYSGGNPSPKKFMSSLREITTNMTKEELDAKNRKEYAYKAQLKKQVDEKKKEKFSEKRKAEELKRRELEEYYRSYYRGNIPPEKMRELRKPIIVEGEEEFFAELREEERREAAMRRGGDGPVMGSGMDRLREQQAPPPLRIPRDDYNDDYDRRPSPMNRGGGRGSPSHRRTYDDYDDYDDDYDYNRGGRGRDGGYDREREKGHYASPPRRTRESPPRVEPPVRKGGSGEKSRPDRGSDWIRKEEYDELSMLCNKLLAQQEELEEEIHDKDAMIKNLKKVNGTKGGLSKAGKEVVGKTPQRSQSVHNMMKPEGRVKGAANAGAKPKSASAFGRRAPDPPPRREKQPMVAKEPKSFVEMSAAGLNRMPKPGRKALAGSKLAAKQDKLPSGGGDSRNGDGKLQLGVRGNQAPKIISHEKDDEDYSARGGGGLRAMQRKVNKVGFKESVEMPGASEYLHNNDGEALSEDQLDRLLIQAKKTRGYER